MKKLIALVSALLMVFTALPTLAEEAMPQEVQTFFNAMGDVISADQVVCAADQEAYVAGMPGIAASFYTSVLNLLKVNTAAGTTRGSSCCVPTVRRPLSLLYYDRDSNIVKTDIPDMVVEACGCS